MNAAAAPVPRPFSGRPRDVVPLPAPVAVIAAGRAAEPVWRNECGGFTFFVPAASLYVKWSPTGGIDLSVEADRLRWCADRQHVPGSAPAVPRLLSSGADADGSWLATAAIPGRNAVDPHWIARPGIAAAAIGSGLRRWHDAVPVEGCPYSWSVADRLANIGSRRHELTPQQWHPEHQHLSVEAAVALLGDPPPVDRLVVCHGDACSPNSLIDESGRACSLVDLGSLGVADRWADLAIATWSLNWNYGPGWERTLLDAYGIEPDPRRTAYYRLLWDLGP